ncbi:MAG: hypothetical protein ABSD46_07580 [Bacteroidota bacterium]
MRYYCGCGPRAVKCIAAAVVMCVVFGVATMLLWNALIPDLFHGPFITFWQAVGLLVLSHILFRSFGGWRHGGWAHHNWRHRFEAKLAAMTPEEREKFKEEYHHCCRKDSDKEQDTKK